MSVHVADGTSSAASRPGLMTTLGLAWRDLALRDVRRGLRGFGIFLACLALGVGAITGIGSLSSALVGGLAREGRVLLGGDAAFTLIHREASQAERAELVKHGEVSHVANTRAMLRIDDERTALVELKAVDEAYPVAGLLQTQPAVPAERLNQLQDGAFPAFADPALFARLDLKPGDEAMLGTVRLRLLAEITREPDRVAAGIGFGPRLMIGHGALQASGLIQPGSLVRHTYRLALPSGASEIETQRVIESVKRAAPEAGWEIRSRANAEPRLAKNIERFTQFLALVGLSALLIGGVGVANAVRGFLDRKRATLAILKSVGATGRRVFAISLIEVMILATFGIAIGLMIGAAIPYLVAWSFGTLLPIPLEPSISPTDLLLGAAYGFVTTLAFALWPLGRAHDIPVSALFRDAIAPGKSWPRLSYQIATACCVVALAVMAIALSWDRRIALITVAATACVFIALRLVAFGLMALARRLPRPRQTELRLALTNSHRPGALTPALVMSLGLGLALIVVLGLIEANLRRELTGSLPGKAPSFFLLDVPSREGGAVEELLQREAPGSSIERVPMMRGRVVALKGVPVAQVRADDAAAWVLEGDRGITYSAAPPAGTVLVAGEWWAPDHRGEALVSFDAELAKGLGLTIGDKLAVNVLGRVIEARIANLRRIEWRSMGINFVMVFSPNTFAGAPHTELATITLAGEADQHRENALTRAMARSYPAITLVRVKDALKAVNDIVEQLATAIRGASLIVLVAAMLVLAGALAAGQRARRYDIVILKTLGATRPRLISALLVEYGILGFITALFAVLAGSMAAYFIVHDIMKMEFVLDPRTVLISLLLALAMTIGLGLAGTWRILGEKAAPYLRNL